MILRERQLAFQILTPCTLNCKLCADYSPLYKQKKELFYVTFEDFKKEVSTIFSIYDYIEDITITGGEPLMHPQLPLLLKYVLEEYHNQFSMCRIFTNGTIMPSTELVEVIKHSSNNNFQFVIDCYGSISFKTDDILSLAQQENISCRINHYYGDSQHCGGWVDYGSLSEYRNYCPQKVQHMFKNCHNATWKNLIVFKGKLSLCTQAMFGDDLGYFKLQKNELLDLTDNSISLEEKKNFAKNLGSKPLTACQYCNGFDPENSARYPAGEQI